VEETMSEYGELLRRIYGPIEAEQIDMMLTQAIGLIAKQQRASVSAIQRHLRIGYTRAARIMDILEEQGLVGPMRGSDQPREVFIDENGKKK
jgi:S-DNA-T family DNA segregation ATPase FtsK/SpoIIIE